jgi:hypothetical protein
MVNLTLERVDQKTAMEEEVETHFSNDVLSLRVWYRRKFTLPPNDPRFLDITDDEILLEYLIDKKIRKEQKIASDDEEPMCEECKYVGPPYPHTDYCPKCGAEMSFPESYSEGDQTVYVDEDSDDALRELGLNPDEINKAFKK